MSSVFSSDSILASMYNRSMRRILLVIENLNELLFLESLLKKMGFDTTSIRNEAAISEQIVSFGPDIVLATGEGSKLDGRRISAKVKKTGSIKLILIYPPQSSQASTPCDASVTAPVAPKVLLSTIARVSGLDEAKILAKFNKLTQAQGLPEPTENSKFVTGSGKPTVAGGPPPHLALDKNSDAERVKKYSKLIENLPETGQTELSADFIDQVVEDIQKNIDDKENKEIDERRQKFVVALFKK